MGSGFIEFDDLVRDSILGRDLFGSVSGFAAILKMFIICDVKSVGCGDFGMSVVAS